MPTRDPAELPQASYWPDMAAELDGDAERRDAELDQVELVHRLFHLMSEGTRKEVEWWAVAVRFHLPFASGIEHWRISEQLGITQAAFSKRVQYYCDLFPEIPRPPACKSQAARLVYARIQRGDHWRERTGIDFARK